MTRFKQSCHLIFAYADQTYHCCATPAIFIAAETKLTEKGILTPNATVEDQ